MASKTTSDSSILIAQIADTHLRDSQYATTRRGEDFYKAVQHAVSAACDKADVLVLVGDIFDRPRPSPRVIGQLMQIDRLLRARGKICFAVTGNHDWCSPTWLATLFPGSAEGGGIWPLDGETSPPFHGFTFTGVLPHTAGKFRQNMATIEAQARGVDVVLYHGLVDGVVPFYIHAENPLHCDEFPIAKDNKAWMLGDIHIRGSVERNRPGGGKCVISYPGSTEMGSASEPLDKGFPIWKLTKDSCELVEVVDTPIRPFFDADITTEEELEEFIKQVEPVADQHPVVIVDFSRELPQTINRLHSMLDAQRAIVRCYPLPHTIGTTKREVDDGEELGMEHFVSKRFGEEGEEDLQSVALALLVRGETDADGIVAAMTEERLATAGIREDD